MAPLQNHNVHVTGESRDVVGSPLPLPFHLSINGVIPDTITVYERPAAIVHAEPYDASRIQRLQHRPSEHLRRRIRLHGHNGRDFGLTYVQSEIHGENVNYDYVIDSSGDYEYFPIIVFPYLYY